MTSTDENPEWFTPAELAKRWRCSTQTVLNMIHHKDEAMRLRAMPLGGSFRVHESAVTERENASVTQKAKPVVDRKRRRRLPAVRDLVGDVSRY